MLTPSSLTLVALSALAGAQGALAQDNNDNNNWQPSSSSQAWGASASASSISGSASRSTNGTAVATASSSASTSHPSTSLSGTNPLIPSTLSSKCTTFLTTLNSDSTLASCTTPLLSALSAFVPSSDLTSYTSSTADISSALSTLCSPTTTAACSDSALRSTLTQFQGNCSAELNQKNDVVLGLYDTLYVLTPLRQAVCTTDAAGGWCLTDIVAGRMPAGSTGANATAVASSVAESASAALASATASAGLNASQVEDVSGQTDGQNLSSPVKLNSLAASGSDDDSKPAIEVPAPPSLYIQVSGAVRRFVKRQWNGNGEGHGDESGASSFASSDNATASAGNSTTADAGNSTAAAEETPAPAPAADSAHPFSNYTLPSLLPSASTWRTSHLPFLFLSPSSTLFPSSSVLCSSCTKSILAAYVAFESRQPYLLGLANSPLLGGQGEVWTGVGERCGNGFLEAAAKEAGQANLTGGATGAVKVAGGVLVGVVAAVMVALA
ncbi:hypothetical protein JCM11251_001806 [Rhodosporidiobolus azoricus]